MDHGRHTSLGFYPSLLFCSITVMEEFANLGLKLTEEIHDLSQILETCVKTKAHT
jgi:phage-related holin